MEIEEFPVEERTFNTTIVDRELLAIRRNEKITDDVFVRLSLEGKREYVYNFTLDGVSDMALEFSLISAKDIYEIISLRDFPRIYEISNRPDIIGLIYSKLRMKIIDNRNLGIRLDKDVKTFDDLMSWYIQSFYDTPWCDNYHNINKCILSTISTNHKTRFDRLMEGRKLNRTILKKLLTERKFDWILEYIHLDYDILSTIINTNIKGDDSYYSFLSLVFGKITIEDKNLFSDTFINASQDKKFIIIGEMIVSLAKSGKDTKEYMKYIPEILYSMLDYQYALYIASNLFHLGQYSKDLEHLFSRLGMLNEARLVREKL